jgi:ribosome maturation protein Sdo1
LTLENEFGTSNEDEVIIKILEGGEVQVSEV